MAKSSRRKERPGVMLYFDRLRPVLDTLSLESVGMLLHAIVDYVQYGAEPQLDGLTNFAFEMMRPSLDNDGERYEQVRQHGQYMAYCKKQKDKGEPALEEDEFIEQLLETESNCQLQTVNDSNKQKPSLKSSPSSNISPSSLTERELEGCKGDFVIMPSYSPLTDHEEQERREAYMKALAHYPCRDTDSSKNQS